MDSRARWLLIAGLLAAAPVVAALLFPAPPPPTVAPAPALAFDGGRALNETRWLAETYPNRVAGTAAGLRSAEGVAERFRRMGMEPRFQNFTAAIFGERRPLVNVLAVSPGSVPDAVVVMGHRDVPRTTVQGANDDASGVGATLELARVVHARPHNLTYVFLAVDGEEWGMLGARHFLDAWDGGKLVAAIEFDMVGTGHYAVLFPGGQFAGYGSLGLVRASVAAGRAAGVPVEPPGLDSQLFDRIFQVSYVDQGPFNARGVPAVTYGTFPQYDPLYHTPEDRVETLSASALQVAGRVVEALVVALDADPGLAGGPTFYLLLGEKTVSEPPLRVLLLYPALLPLAIGLADLRRGAARKAALRKMGLALLPFLAGTATAYLLVPLGLVPPFELYPPPPKDPYLLDVQLLPFGLPVAVLLGGLALSLGPMRLEERPGGEVPLALLVLGGVGLLLYATAPFANLLLALFVAAWLPLRSPRAGRWSGLALALLPAALTLAAGFGLGSAFLGPGLLRPLWYGLLLIATRTIPPALVGAFAVLLGLTLLLALRAAARKPLSAAAPS